MRGRWLIGVLVAGTMLVAASGAMACSCAPQPPGESLRESDAAVVGRLVEVVPHGPLHAVYRYELRHVYRGAKTLEPERMLDVHSARRAPACALPRRLGRSYGLFLTRAGGRWYGGICGVVSPKRMRTAAAAQLASAPARAGCR